MGWLLTPSRRVLGAPLVGPPTTDAVLVASRRISTPAAMLVAVTVAFGTTAPSACLPYGVIGASCNLPSAGGCRASYNPNFTGSARINGEWGSGDLLGARPAFLDAKAFMNPAPYTYGNTPGAGAYGLCNPGFWNEDVGVTRQFGITERFKLDFSAQAFNVANTVIFNGPASLDINNANFGRITGQQNSPRSMQFALKLNF